MKAIERYGEIYYSVENLQEFIEQCNYRTEVILSLEFFEITSEKVMPFSMLQSIDSTYLYDENRSIVQNANVCNSFIRGCVIKKIKELSGLYFNAILKK